MSLFVTSCSKEEEIVIKEPEFIFENYDIAHDIDGDELKGVAQWIDRGEESVKIFFSNLSFVYSPGEDFNTRYPDYFEILFSTDPNNFSDVIRAEYNIKSVQIQNLYSNTTYYLKVRTVTEGFDTSGHSLVP